MKNKIQRIFNAAYVTYLAPDGSYHASLSLAAQHVQRGLRIRMPVATPIVPQIASHAVVEVAKPIDSGRIITPQPPRYAPAWWGNVDNAVLIELRELKLAVQIAETALSTVPTMSGAAPIQRWNAMQRRPFESALRSARRKMDAFRLHHQLARTAAFKPLKAIAADRRIARQYQPEFTSELFCEA